MIGAEPEELGPTPPPPPGRHRPRPLRWLWTHLPEARADRALVIATLTALLLSNPGVAQASEEDAPILDPTTTSTMASTTTTVAPAPRTAPIEPPANPR